MKKLMVLIGVLLLVIILPGSVMAAPAEKIVFYPGNSKYIINDTELTMDAMPFIIGGRTYLPVKFLTSVLGAEDKLTFWDKPTGTVSLYFRGNKNVDIILHMGSQQLEINYLDAETNKVLNSKTAFMDVMPVLRDGLLYLPARWVAEACGFAVKWDSNTQSIMVYAPGTKEASTNGVIVCAREIKSTTDQLELNMQIPIITGMTNKSLQEKINKEVLDKALQTKNELESSYKEYTTSAKEFDFPVYPFQLYVAYEAYTSGGVLSLVVETYQYSGGAHGLTWRDYYNLDTQNGRQLSLQELFKDNAGYINTINGEIQKRITDQINSGQGMYFEGDEGFKTISANHPFYINDNHIVLCFGQYEIAPYAAGMPEFQLPIDMLSQQWREDFLNLVQ